jgi:hypothetical protein
MNRIITYAIDKVSGLVFSQVGREIAFPVLDYKGMNPENNFRIKYYLEKGPALTAYIGTDLRWSRKIPNAVKNVHRAFWNMKPLKGKNRWE